MPLVKRRDSIYPSRGVGGLREHQRSHRVRGDLGESIE
jgi:hypothetical protein